jgi:hypothetical protein
MPRPENYDDFDDRPSRSRDQFPVGVRVAGIIWIVFGALGLIGQAILLVVNMGQPAAAQGGGGPVGSPFAGVGCGVLFALAFLFVGIQTVKGTAKSTLGNGIGSIIFAVLYLICGAVLMAGSGFVPAGANTTLLIVMGVIIIVQGLALLTAGALALMGKSAYEEWRVAQGLDRRKRRTQEERDYEDDRPRRRRRDFDDDEDRSRRRERDDDDRDDRPRRRRDEDDER